MLQQGQGLRVLAHLGPSTTGEGGMSTRYSRDDPVLFGRTATPNLKPSQSVKANLLTKSFKYELNPKDIFPLSKDVLARDVPGPLRNYMTKQ